MTLEVLVKYVHFISIFAIIAAVSGEYLLLADQLPRHQIKRLSRLDAIYGVSAITLLAAGMTLWFVVGKPADYYSKNWIFLTKIGLFIIVGILSLVPTVFFNRNRKGDPNTMITVPKAIRTYIILELILLGSMPLLATLMAKGLGTF